jgi:hypothetical protein
MVLSIIFLEDNHKIVLHLSILYEYQMYKKSVIFIHLFNSGILLIIDLNKKKGKKGRRVNFTCEFYSLNKGYVSTGFKSVIQSGCSLFLSKIKNKSLKLPVGVSPLQLVNLHKNRRYFVVQVEHDIGDLKRYKILSTILRHKGQQLKPIAEIRAAFVAIC